MLQVEHDDQLQKRVLKACALVTVKMCWSNLPLNGDHLPNGLPHGFSTSFCMLSLGLGTQPWVYPPKFPADIKRPRLNELVVRYAARDMEYPLAI